jgi:hypothetical protein
VVFFCYIEKKLRPLSSYKKEFAISKGIKINDINNESKRYNVTT